MAAHKDSTPPTNFADFLRTTADDPMFVVLGVQGSGTNLLTRLLERIFGFSVLLDRSMVFRSAARMGPSPTEAQIERGINTVLARLFPSALTVKLRRDAIRDNAAFRGIQRHLTPSAIRNGRDLARTVYAYRAHSLGSRRMAIKSDDLWQDIASIDQVLPNRRIVLLTRDFRDNLLSVSGKDFGPIEPLCAARYVKDQFSVYHREFLRAGVNGLHVRFEDLVEAPLRFVTEFSTRFQISPATDPREALDGFELRQSKVRKWVHLMNPVTLEHCEALLSNELQHHGYELTVASPRTPQRATLVAARIRDVRRRIPQKIRKVLKRLQRQGSPLAATESDHHAMP